MTVKKEKKSWKGGWSHCHSDTVHQLVFVVVVGCPPHLSLSLSLSASHGTCLQTVICSLCGGTSFPFLLLYLVYLKYQRIKQASKLTQTSTYSHTHTHTHTHALRHILEGTWEKREREVAKSKGKFRPNSLEESRRADTLAHLLRRHAVSLTHWGSHLPAHIFCHSNFCVLLHHLGDNFILLTLCFCRHRCSAFFH